MKVLFLKGLPGSGKTTWAREFLSRNKDWVRVSRDDLRNMRGDYWVIKQEDLITAWERLCIITALSYDKNVIVDATNLNERFMRSLKRFIKEEMAGIDITYKTKFFDVSVAECIRNDLKRSNSVGAAVIWEKYNKYLAPTPVVYKEAPELLKCIICDIDGTLAINNTGRSMYANDNSVLEDTVNIPVLTILKTFRKSIPCTKIILFSGRKDSCYDATRTWLRDYEVPYDFLHMRAENDNRKDTIVKKEMFEEYIRGKFYVSFVLDDRKQVVDMWRKELGLTCLQVADGNF